jgi:hypothetical protein
MAPSQVADGTWELAFNLTEAGKHTIVYETVAHTAAGPTMVAQDEVSFDVYATRRVKAEIRSPKGTYEATDMFLRPTGLPLQVQLVDEKGNELGPGQVGAVNPMNLFSVTVTDTKGVDRSSELQMGNTGKFGLFEAQGRTLGPGTYTVVVRPGSGLAREYIWAADEWAETVTGRISLLSLVPVGAVVALLAAISLLVFSSLAVRRHPLTGYIEVYENKLESAISEDGEPRSYKHSVFREQLPKRNRVVYRARFWHRSQGTMPAKYIKVACPTPADSDAKRASVVIGMKDGSTLETVLSPDSAPYPIGLGHLIEKGPRAIADSGSGVAEGADLGVYGSREQ